MTVWKTNVLRRGVGEDWGKGAQLSILILFMQVAASLFKVATEGQLQGFYISHPSRAGLCGSALRRR